MAGQSLKKAINAFHEDFSNWDITLREEDVRDGEVGQIVHRGWTIKFKCGEDERGRYLDSYATHRMTNDRHVRMYADGTRQSLPAICTMRVGSSDPEEDAKLEKEFMHKQRAVMNMLDEKGFGMCGDEHGSLQIQRCSMFGDDTGSDADAPKDGPL